MKTQVNHHYQLNAVGTLITVSILLLAFGIYKTLQLQEKEMFKSYTYTSEITTIPNEVAKNHSLNLTNELFENETPLEIESWMLDYSTWLAKPTLSIAPAYYAYDEKELDIKNWMLSTENWEVLLLTKNQWNEIKTTNEKPLAIEPWMTDIDSWFNKN